MEVDYDRRTADLKAKYIESQQRQDLLLQAAKQELDTVKLSIQEREKYAKRQEFAINDQAEAGNTRLRGIDYEITEAKHVLKESKLALHDVSDNLKVLTVDLDQARDDMEVEINRLQAGVDTKQSELDQLQADVVEQESQLVIVTNRTAEQQTEIDKKLRTLDVKEREIMAKRDALQREELDMAEKRHRQTSRDRLYNVE